jgi:hypothetical protein
VTDLGFKEMSGGRIVVDAIEISSAGSTSILDVAERDLVFL